MLHCYSIVHKTEQSASAWSRLITQQIPESSTFQCWIYIITLPNAAGEREECGRRGRVYKYEREKERLSERERERKRGIGSK